MIKIHKIYLLKKFIKKILTVSGVFFVLVIIVNLIEEANFLKNTDSNFFTPLILTILNSPSLLNEMMPFIFLISTQFFFIDIYENKEIFTLKQFGLDNFAILKFLSLISFILGILIVTLFYNFSSILKNQYLKIKNNYTTDSKYLAVITKNGLWIKDNSENGTVIINADKIENNHLFNLSITKLNKDFEIEKNIIAEKSNVNDFTWKIYNAVVTESNNSSTKFKTLTFESNFNSERINNLFSDLSSLTFFELQKLKEDYKEIGYSIDDIDIQAHKYYSLPFLLMAMTIVSIIIMINNKFKNNLLINILIGIFFSVLIYYISHFSNILGSNGKLPIIVSVWFPVFIILLISSIGIVRLNEK